MHTTESSQNHHVRPSFHLNPEPSVPHCVQIDTIFWNMNISMQSTPNTETHTMKKQVQEISLEKICEQGAATWRRRPAQPMPVPSLAPEPIGWIKGKYELILTTNLLFPQHFLLILVSIKNSPATDSWPRQLTATMNVIPIENFILMKCDGFTRFGVIHNICLSGVNVWDTFVVAVVTKIWESRNDWEFTMWLINRFVERFCAFQRTRMGALRAFSAGKKFDRIF